MASLAPSEEPSAPSEQARVPDAAADPHRSKIAPDDPRLRLGRARGRTLKRGPALALAASLLGVILVSLVIALDPSPKTSSSRKGDASDPTAVEAGPVVPDAIRYAADKPPLVGPPLHMANRRGDGGLFPVAGESGYSNDRNGDSRDPSSSEHTKQLEQEQTLKARSAGILFEVSTTGPSTSGALGGPGVSAESSKLSPLPTAQAAPGSDDPNGQERKNAFLDQLGAARTKATSESHIEKPRSPYEIQAGSIIPAVLITAINSDLPGPVIGQVRENVYDTVTGNHLLIPQGSRLLATYDSMVAWGQERVLVCWNRLLFPNGDSLALACMPAADLQGSAGLTGDVNEHWGRLLKGAAISSLLAATAVAAAGNTEGFTPTVPQTLARNAGGEINQIGQRLTARNMSVQPTITIQAGYSVNVMVTQDLIVPPYRQDLARVAAPPRGPKPW